MDNLAFRLDKSELRKIADVLSSLEYEEERNTGVHWISGGFCDAEMYNYDDDFIYVELRWGVQSDCSDDSHTEEWKLNRKTLKWEDN
jgi:hypothetical protein